MKILSKILKYIPESKAFLCSIVSIVILLSLYLRSMIDIGPDTGIYLDLGKKIAENKRYFYDFFESNFPLSFYFYAAQYKISQLIKINPIILSEIIINLLAFISIYVSAKILQKSTIYNNKAHYNLIIISYVLGFFLRPHAIEFGEFGTKTSLLLIALFPYISYSFQRIETLNKKDLVYRGILMGIIPCIKPHYLILILSVEIYKFFKTRKLNFFFTLDMLIMYLIGLSYLLFLIKITPEFLEFIVPLWPKIYLAYDDFEIFFDNSFRHLASRGMVFGFIFLIFSRLKMDENDKILLAFFIGASLLIILENIGSFDQLVIFFAIATICFAKFTYDLIKSNKLPFLDNKFFTFTLLIIPIFDLSLLPTSYFGVSSFINIWWVLALIYPVIFFKQHNVLPSLSKIFIGILIYFSFLIIALLSLKYLGVWQFLAFNLIFLFITIFYFENKIYSKFSKQFSKFSHIIILASFACLIYSYIGSLFNKNQTTQPNKMTDIVMYYAKTKAPKTSDIFIAVGNQNSYQFPMQNYLNKENGLKMHVMGLNAAHIFKTEDTDKNLTLSYLFDNLKKLLKDQNTKLLVVHNQSDILDAQNRCLINSIEYYLMDIEFRKIFLNNFKFENRAIINNKDKIIFDFEIYVRK